MARDHSCVLRTGNGNGQRSSSSTGGGSNFETLPESVHFPSPLSSAPPLGARSGLRPPFSFLRPIPKGQRNPDTAPHLPLPSFLPYSHTPLPSTTSTSTTTTPPGKTEQGVGPPPTPPRRPPPPPPPCRSRPDLRRWGTGVPGSTPPPRVSLPSWPLSCPAPPSLLEGSCVGSFLFSLPPRTSGVRLGFAFLEGI